MSIVFYHSLSGSVLAECFEMGRGLHGWCGTCSSSTSSSEEKKNGYCGVNNSNSNSTAPKEDVVVNVTGKRNTRTHGEIHAG